MSEYSCVSPATAAFRFSRIAHLLEILEMAVRVPGLALGSGTKHRRHIVIAFDIRFGREVQVATIGLRFAGKGVLQILFGPGSSEFHER
jgi:hypothetical protein